MIKNTSVSDRRFEEYSVLSLSDYVNRDQEEMLFCPIRALEYLNRTVQCCPACPNLIVSVTNKGRHSYSKTPFHFGLDQQSIILMGLLLKMM